MKLVKYDAACRAIAAATKVDEVKSIRDKAVAMATYARQAKNKDLEANAIEIRMRATRRIDQLRQAQKETVGLNPGTLRRGVEQTPRDARPTLAAQGIDKNLAKQARTLGAMSIAEFEAGVVGARAAVNRIVKNVVNAGDKAGRRTTREADLGSKQIALPNRKYGVVLADVEWRFEPWSRKTGMDRAADNHYPTSPTEVIAARDVSSIAADDCVLFLWATAPMLPQALTVMAAWDFEYRSHAMWAKNRIGTGYWFRNKHEILLVGVRGNIPAPAMGMQWPSLIEAPVTKHSAKPERFLEMIEAYFPTLPKIELNRRGPAPGWDAWGLEAVPEAAE